MARWDGKERRQRENLDRLTLEVPLNGNLDKVLRLFILALGSGLQAIALALSTPHDNSAEVQKRLDKLASNLTLTATEQQDALDKFNQPKEK